jgi:exonuclease III
MYVPNRGNDPLKLSRKKTYLERWLSFLANPFSTQHARILLGDLNVVPSGHWPQFLPQQQFEYDWYEGLDRRGGLYDAATIHSAEGHESTWVAHSGEGYTYDHIMVQKALSGRVKTFFYDHSTRLTGTLSDHSALVIKIEFDAVRNHVQEPPERTQPTLFDF